ncbi:hypothetical protein FAK_09210 [Desulfoferula mesophila]|uniref:Uncharacterized protein n=1 Tax=Desulfoferula mesophila TaxID=3058419 RepID=A0AAU9EPQ1_9BACT|nr:hypothetical protein FAK_09210 [Desulfoferula mesophilus]
MADKGAGISGAQGLHFDSMYFLAELLQFLFVDLPALRQIDDCPVLSFGELFVCRQSVWDKNWFLLMETFPVDLGFNNLFV